MEYELLQSPMISYRSLLYSTTMLYYIYIHGTNQPQLKRDKAAKCKKMRVTSVHTQKLNFACAHMCYLNQLLNGYLVDGSLSVGTLKY